MTPEAGRRGERRGLARSYMALSRRLTPERTRRATFFERLTVSRLKWQTLVRLNGLLELSGRIATGLLVAFAISAFAGVDWRRAAESTLNSGRAIEEVLALIIVIPVLTFIALRSLIGFARRRVQRELWRRDVASCRSDLPPVDRPRM